LEDYFEGFLEALRHVTQAWQMTKVAQDSGISGRICIGRFRMMGTDAGDADGCGIEDFDCYR
jgi:hypothetical protein